MRKIQGHHDGLAFRWPNDGGYRSRSETASPGSIRNHPAFRNSSPKKPIGDLVSLKPVIELISRLFGQRITQKQTPKIFHHRIRRCRVPVVARYRLIKLRLPAIKTRYIVTQTPYERCYFSGPPRACKTKFAAVLSLIVRAASQKFASVMA